MPKKTQPGKKPSASRKAPVRSKARNRSWLPGRKGQGGEGLSKGYGGSAGDGTGASGPDHVVDDRIGADDDRVERKYQSLPSRERIARVLR